MSDKTQLRQQRDDLIKLYGAWTAHCVHLGKGIYTFDEPQVAQPDSRVRRSLQVAADMVLAPLDKIRVLDIACLEGMFAVEFALHGATVVGIEGRDVNLAKAGFTKNVLSLENLELIHDDVRNLNRKRFGGYDVVLVYGILYHLDAPDVMEFAQNIYESCDRVAIIDTNFSLEPNASYTWKGNVYWGTYWEEHRPGSTDTEKLDALWASIGNQRSFVLTSASLCNLLRHVGFTSVYECLNPYEYHNPNWPLAPDEDRHVVHRDRATFVAIKGQDQRVMSSPITQALPEIDRPEHPEYSRPNAALGQAKPEWARRLLAPLPEPAKSVLRKMYRLTSGRRDKDSPDESVKIQALPETSHVRRSQLTADTHPSLLGSSRQRPEHAVPRDSNSPKTVSVVITTYNHARFLAESIESAFGQTVRPAEVIVVDDGSTDDPGAVVSQYLQVQLIRQPNQGLASARNTGWRATHGRYVVFLDADDRLLPEALASNLRRFDEKPECAFVYGSYDYIDAGGQHLSSPAPNLVGEDAYESLLKENCVAMHATVMYRRDCLEQVGGFDARLPCCEDYELYLRLARRYPVAAGGGRIAEYRRHTGNMSLNYPHMFNTVLEVLRRQLQHTKDNLLWRTALKAGFRHWKSCYAHVQVSQSLTAARASGLRQIPWSATARVFALAPATFVRIAGRRLSAGLHSRLMPLRRKSVRFGDLRRLRPIGLNFGFDRGTPVDRRYIEDFLSRNAEGIKGRVLEIGDNAYTRQYGEARVTHSDVLHVDGSNPRATLVGDLAEGDHLPSEVFDCIVLTQTLQYVFDVHKAVATLHRMLKPGGVLLLTVPGVTSIDRGEWAASWCWSLSSVALSRLLRGKFGEANVSVTSYGNVLAAVAFLHGLAESELRPSELDAHDLQYPVIVAARAVKAVPA